MSREHERDNKDEDEDNGDDDDGVGFTGCETSHGGVPSRQGEEYELRVLYPSDEEPGRVEHSIGSRARNTGTTPGRGSRRPSRVFPHLQVV